MNEVELIIADPAGNITAIVLNTEINREDYPHIAAKLMNLPEWAIEQVGFVREPQMGGELRLEMMGGEFCGNAARSFGLYIAASRGESSARTINIEVSGSSALLAVETDVARGYAKTAMPLPSQIDSLPVAEEIFPVVVFEGIIHVIAENKEPRPDLFAKVKSAVMSRFNPEAFGLMFFRPQSLELTPVVYVRATNSTVYEQSCGSGTVAAAGFLAWAKGDGVHTFEVRNPGGTITTVIGKQNGKIQQAAIAGRVILSAKKTIRL